MTNSILVTGGTHGLGAPTVAHLKQTESTVRVLSRRTGQYRGDLSTGDGLDAALDGVDVVLHLATTRKKDLGITQNLLSAAKRAQVAHVVYISIVGVDHIDFAYYRDKLANEHLIEKFGLPYTILRATQFHSLVGSIFAAKLPFRVALPISAQPIATDDVATRLTELALAPPAGRVPDIGGPEILTMRQMARQWNDAHHSRRPVLPIPLGGKTIRGFKAGQHMPGLPGYGTETFNDYALRAATK